MSQFLKSGSFWFALSAALLLVAGVVASVVLWGWLHPEVPTTVSNSETLRNVGLMIGGVLAFVFALWRGWVAERQAGTAQQSLLNERYQKGAEMLGSDVLSVRLGGIYALERLATEHPQQYHVRIMKLLCAFARRPTRDEDYEIRVAERNANPRKLSSSREDVQAAIDAIGSRDETRVEIEKSQGFELSLIEADLSHTRIKGANLSGAKLHYANLSNTEIATVDLSQAHLQGTVMKKATLNNVDFTDARAQGVDLSGAMVFQNGKPLFDLYSANLSPAQLSDGTQSLTQLFDVDPSGKSIQDAKLDQVRITTSDLSDTHFLDSNLSRARILKSRLSGAEVLRTDMSGAILRDTDLSGTYFYNPHCGTATDLVTGLTQAQLDDACADPDNPPKLDGVLDAVTGKPLVWRGQPCHKNQELEG